MFLERKNGLPKAAEGRFFDGLLQTSARGGKTSAEEEKRTGEIREGTADLQRGAGKNGGVENGKSGGTAGSGNRGAQAL